MRIDCLVPSMLMLRSSLRSSTCKALELSIISASKVERHGQKRSYGDSHKCYMIIFIQGHVVSGGASQSGRILQAGLASLRNCTWWGWLGKVEKSHWSRSRPSRPLHRKPITSKARQNNKPLNIRHPGRARLSTFFQTG